LAECAPDIFRYVATEGDTLLQVDFADEITPTLSESLAGGGAFVEITTASPHVVISSKPLYAFQYLLSRSSGFPVAVNGDPAMVQMIPVTQYLDEYFFLTPESSDPNHINLILPADGTTSLSLDGNPISPSCTNAGLSYCCARLQVSAGVHSVSADEPFGLLVSGYVTNGSYMYAGGAKVGLANATTTTPPPTNPPTLAPALPV
jgi:hypothetical protein